MYRESLAALYKAIEEDKSNIYREDDEKFVKSRCYNILDYVTYVFEQGVRLAEAKENSIQEDYIALIQQMDSVRQTKHNTAIDSCDQLNRMCLCNGVPLIFKVDLTDRVKVGDYCEEFVKENFANVMTEVITNVKMRERELAYKEDFSFQSR